MDASNSLVDLLARLLVKMPFLRGADFKVAFYLVVRALTSASAEVSISERALSDATGISKTTIQVALKRLEMSGLFLREHGSYNRPDRFLLPAFRPANGVLKIGPPVSEIGTPGVPEIGTPGVPEIGTGVPEIGTPGVPETDTGVPETGTGGPEIDPAPYKERAGARRNRIESIGSSRSSIDRCLAQTTLDPTQADAARLLRGRLRSFVQRAGNDTLSGASIDDKIIAQCLAIAPLERLLSCLVDLQDGKMVKPRKYAWFVSVFLERIHGYTPNEVAAAREALRPQPKPAREESADLAFVAGIKHALAEGAKGIK